MKPFCFQRFKVNQNDSVFRVGTDAVVLGALASCKGFDKVLEIGTGTGIISLMLAQRNPDAEILAIDIDENSVKLARKNFRNSDFSGRLRALHKDFKDLSAAGKFGLIISNPPYFEENQSSKHILARQKVTLKFDELISGSAKHLSEDGVFSVIIPSDQSAEFIGKCSSFNLNLSRIINVYGIKGGSLKRNVLEFSFEAQKVVSEDFYIECAHRVYSDQYLEATQDFHLFTPKSK